MQILDNTTELAAIAGGSCWWLDAYQSAAGILIYNSYVPGFISDWCNGS